MTLGLFIATLLSFLDRLFWGFELLSHFRVQYFQIALVLIFIALWKRLHKRAAALVLLAAVNYAFVLPLYFGRPDTTAKEPIRAMLMNINAANGNTEMVLGSIEQFAPDLLLMEEVTPEWARQLEVLDSKYPYRMAEPQEGCFGIMLLSKYPVERGEVVIIGSAGLPSVVTDVHLPDGGILSLIGTHSLPPISRAHAGHRNRQLMDLPAMVKRQRHPVLLIGDLNTTPFSCWFRKLVSESGLQNSMQGFGFQPSWPANMPFMRIPIDHVLHSPEIVIHNRFVGNDVGSDHFPVIVDFSMR